MERSATVQPLPENLAGNLSKGYHYREGTYNAQNFEWVSNAPSAPVHATATDMSSFMLAFAQTYVWPTETVSTITRLWLLNVPLTLGIVVLGVPCM